MFHVALLVLWFPKTLYQKPPRDYNKSQLTFAKIKVLFSLLVVNYMGPEFPHDTDELLCDDDSEDECECYDDD